MTFIQVTVQCIRNLMGPQVTKLVWETLLPVDRALKDAEIPKGSDQAATVTLHLTS